MKSRVYLETTIISYLAARPASDSIVAGHQGVTREWWTCRREAFELVISDLVLREAQAGDSEAARRLEIETIVTGEGYACPVICTPEELLED